MRSVRKRGQPYENLTQGEAKQEEKNDDTLKVNYWPTPLPHHDFPKLLCERIKTLFVLGPESCRLSFDLPAPHTHLSVAYSLSELTLILSTFF